MAQSIDLVTRFMPILDDVYKKSSLTSRMDAQTKPIEFAGAATVKVFKTDIIGLGNYSRLTGYPKGQIVGTWETLTLSASRGREFSIDRMDDEESLNEAFGTLAGEFIRTKVVPEVDAYRFNKYASWSGIEEVDTPATLTEETVLAAIAVATGFMNGKEVPTEGRLLYVSDTVGAFLDQAITRTRANESSIDNRVNTYNGMPVIMVPQTRFYKGLTFDAGAAVDAGGFTKTSSSGRDINFLMVHPSSVLQATKLAQLKIWTPDENQEMDAWKIQYRLYHDAFVYTNKVDAVYSHIKAS